jgi:hypothetical protein
MPEAHASSPFGLTWFNRSLRVTFIVSPGRGDPHPRSNVLLHKGFSATGIADLSAMPASSLVNGAAELFRILAVALGYLDSSDLPTACGKLK